MNHFPKHTETQLEKELEQQVISTYKKLVTSRYFTKSQIEQIVMDTKEHIGHPTHTTHIKQVLVYIKGILSLAIQFNTHDEYERRFSQFFSSLLDEITDLIKGLDPESKEYNQILEQVLFYYVYDAYLTKSPWPYLVQKLADIVPPRQLEKMNEFLEEAFQKQDYARSTKISYSYIQLLIGKEDKALALLQKEIPVSQQEVTPHFLCLKKRQRWQTIQQWLTFLFPNRGERGYGSLQGIADEMQASLRQSTHELNAIWKRWLLSPSFQRFQSLLTHVPAEEQQALIDELTEELKKTLHQSESTLTYIRILNEYKRYEEAANYFLIHEHDPLRLHQEKKKLLKQIEDHHPSLAKPIHHQFVVRLVEKKSRVHYEAAVASIRILKTVYDQLDERERFFHYLAKMKKQYRTYRAFVEELKAIE
ncbi:hypothetical protein RYX56_11510 [Alkalihalophilus lindianensis]|uniref:Uncharacterized protein n=1 Tax=Alkalihalophilus lindianensis TaxID=1630542 RepID=A0ABU3XAS8_9BACI|nr:hypothetical protein [Alkalihalophilus lindianensis]MDV2684997.1 hypothetical protein [Alkalihalophilus lindianensis]